MLRSKFAAAILLAEVAETVLGYQWPVLPDSGSISDPSPINAVVGEYRDTTPFASCNAARCPHFHDGVDIGRPGGWEVYPSVSGTVSKGAISGETVTVIATIDGSKFGYIHIKPDDDLAESVGEENAPPFSVTAGVDVLGRVIPKWSHLHFREKNSADTTVLNKLRSGGLDNFVDNISPVVSTIDLFDADSPGAALGTVVPVGTTDIIIRTHAQDIQSIPPGSKEASKNTGIYQIGYRVYSEDGSTLIEDNFPTNT